MAQSVEKKAGPLRDPAPSKSYGRILLDAVAEVVLNVAIFTLRFVWWTLRWSFASVVFVGIMAAAGWYVFNRAVAGGAYVVVPDIKNRPINEAVYLLERQGLTLGAQEERPSDAAPKFTVLAQRPEAGKVVRAARSVFVTVSTGEEKVKTPNLVGQTFAAADDLINRSPFRLGAQAAILHASPPNTVIAQDPPAAHYLARGAEINLLLSKGVGGTSRPVYMPDLIGKSLDEVAPILTAAGLNGAPTHVERTGAPLDVVLDQKPVAGSLVRPGDVVSYDVRLSNPAEAPQARRKREVTYTVPNSTVPREVRVDFVDKDGLRRPAFPREQDYVDGAPPKFPGNTPFPIRVTFSDEVTVEVYLDGAKVRSYYFQGDAQPVITNYANP